MAQTIKTAISLPAETYAQGERLRKKNGTSRSALYADALRAYVKALEVREAEAQYVAGYLAHPEDPDEVKAFSKVGMHTLKKEKW